MAPFAFRIKAPAVRTIFPEPFVEGSPLLWAASTPNTREMNGRILKDDQGIVLIQYQDFVGVVDGTYYSPEKIGYHSLNNYHGWLVTKDEQLKQEFLLHASWLRDNLVLKNANGKTFGVWLYQYDYVYGSWLVLKKPWPSGLAQGRGRAALVHAWKVTGDNSYLKAARFAFEAFLIGSQSGGLRHDSPYGVWLPEYPGNTQPRYVLNGFCAAILGLFDYARLARDRRAEELYQRAVQTVARALPLYKTTQEGRQLSSYDLMKRPSRCCFRLRVTGESQLRGRPYSGDRTVFTWTLAAATMNTGAMVPLCGRAHTTTIGPNVWSDRASSIAQPMPMRALTGFRLLPYFTQSPGSRPCISKSGTRGNQRERTDRSRGSGAGIGYFDIAYAELRGAGQPPPENVQPPPESV